VGKEERGGGSSVFVSIFIPVFDSCPSHLWRSLVDFELGTIGGNSTRKAFVLKFAELTQEKAARLKGSCR
jgi:hypothetical protein